MSAALHSEVPPIRVRSLNSQPVRPDGEFVLYWMIAARRTTYNFSLQRAVEWSRTLGKPLLIVEPIGCRAEWSTLRFHRFVLQGMVDQQARCQAARVAYYPYVEAAAGAARGWLETLAKSACLIVTDDFPAYFLPRMITALADRVFVPVEAIDSNGLLPMRATEVVFPTAYAFRRFLQKQLPAHLGEFPWPDPLGEYSRTARDVMAFQPYEIPSAILAKWPRATAEQLSAEPNSLQALPIDQSVGPAAFTGGEQAARKVLNRFFEHRLPRYAEHRNDPDEEAASGLSPYLHFGHISVQEIFAELIRREGWQPTQLAVKANGSREGWWGMSPPAESFLDELITWRELGYNFCSHRGDYDQYESLPGWAKQTLREHARDPRPQLYTLAELEAAATHDPLWNAAQRELVRDGRMHNYLRMLWGKKVLEWSPSPEDALATLIHLNNKYAVDGRNPNSYSGIFWCLGRYDRAWGPERPIFGKIRYMSSTNTARKLDVTSYLQKFGVQRHLFS